MMGYYYLYFYFFFIFWGGEVISFTQTAVITLKLRLGAKRYFRWPFYGEEFSRP